MQTRLFKKKTRCRRYSSSIKQYYLAVYFASPRAYRNIYKSNIFCLPSYSILRKFVQHYYIDSGLQDNVLQILKIKVDALDEINKYCIICIDEM